MATEKRGVRWLLALMATLTIVPLLLLLLTVLRRLAALE
jgi:hypothetical protein